MTGPIQADHYVVALAIEDCCVLMHDPPLPYATLPLADFMAAWAADTVDYGAPYTLRTGFTRVSAVSETEAIRAALPAAARWLAMDPQRPVPAGTLGNADAAEALADRLLDGCDDALRMHLIHFAVRVGARRASDAAACLARAGCPQAAAVAAEQARYIGALQHPLVTRRDASAARCLPAGADLLATARGPARGVLRQSAGDGRGTDTIRPGAVAWAPASTPKDQAWIPFNGSHPGTPGWRPASRARAPHRVPARRRATAACGMPSRPAPRAAGPSPTTGAAMD